MQQMPNRGLRECRGAQKNRSGTAGAVWLLGTGASSIVAVLSGVGVIFSRDGIKRALIAATWTAVGLSFVGRFFSSWKRMKPVECQAEAGEKPIGDKQARRDSKTHRNT